MRVRESSGPSRQWKSLRETEDRPVTEEGAVEEVITGSPAASLGATGGLGGSGNEAPKSQAVCRARLLPTQVPLSFSAPALRTQWPDSPPRQGAAGLWPPTPQTRCQPPSASVLQEEDGRGDFPELELTSLNPSSTLPSPSHPLTWARGGRRGNPCREGRRHSGASREGPGVLGAHAGWPGLTKACPPAPRPPQAVSLRSTSQGKAVGAEARATKPGFKSGSGDGRSLAHSRGSVNKPRSLASRDVPAEAGDGGGEALPWPGRLGSWELWGRSAVPVTGSGPRVPRWPERASAPPKGSTSVPQPPLHPPWGAAGIECSVPLPFEPLLCTQRTCRDGMMSTQRALGTSGSRKGTGPQEVTRHLWGRANLSSSSCRHCSKN